MQGVYRKDLLVVQLVRSCAHPFPEKDYNYLSIMSVMH